jgi:hypothetical protein
MDSMDNCEKINELTLTVAKLEATLTEAEETHLGEVRLSIYSFLLGRDVCVCVFSDP